MAMNTRALTLAVWLAACGSNKSGDVSTGDPASTLDAGVRLDAASRDARIEAADESQAPPRQDGRVAVQDSSLPGSPRSDAATPASTGTDIDGAVTSDASLPRDATLGPASARAVLETLVYVGGWDWSGRPYPYREYRLDRQTGALSALRAPIDLGPNPSYGTPSPDGRFLYVSNELESRATITVAAVDRSTGRLSELERESWGARGAPVFASFDPSGKWLLAANYYGGEVLVHRVESDGRLSAPVDIEALGKTAQTHSVRVHPSGKFAYAPNKGRNDIASYTFDVATGKLAPLAHAPFIATGADSWPRHFAFTPDGSYAYVSCERASTVIAYRVAADGTLLELARERSLPAGYSGPNDGAHLLVHPQGKAVYMSNRGHDSIVVFAIESDGRLRLLEHEPSRGKIPRNFDIDSTGTLLVVANQGDDNVANGTVAVFQIESDGKLAPLGTPVSGLARSNAVALITREQLRSSLE